MARLRVLELTSKRAAGTIFGKPPCAMRTPPKRGTNALEGIPSQMQFLYQLAFFVVEEHPFSVDAPAISRNVAIAMNDPVTWDHDSDLISSASTCNRSR